MPAARAFDGASGFARLGRFAVVGVGATLLYGVLAIALLRAGPVATNPAAASLAAYVVAALFSYAGHKFFTFVSNGSHTFEAPRFAALTLFGLVLSWVLPALLADRLGLPAEVPIALTCVLVPLINYVVLGRWVFAPNAATGNRVP
jgi:putative flippase GtrA